MRLGSEPAESGSVLGTMHRGWINLKAAMTSGDEEAVLAEVERGEAAAVDLYEEVLEEDLPEPLREQVAGQLEEVRRAHDRVRSMRGGLD